ncbi:UNVERIFIED_CONTAM: hypothetical protein FKN15_022660 [Acipenser sinensis]
MGSLPDYEKDLILLGKISATISNDKLTTNSKRKEQMPRKHQRTTYYIQGHRVCREAFKFLHWLWRTLVPYIRKTRPMTDLCWTCQKNNSAIYRRVNISDEKKSERLQNQQAHLNKVALELSLYQEMVRAAKVMIKTSGDRLALQRLVLGLSASNIPRRSVLGASVHAPRRSVLGASGHAPRRSVLGASGHAPRRSVLGASGHAPRRSVLGASGHAPRRSVLGASGHAPRRSVLGASGHAPRRSVYAPQCSVHAPFVHAPQRTVP